MPEILNKKSAMWQQILKDLSNNLQKIQANALRIDSQMVTKSL